MSLLLLALALAALGGVAAWSAQQARAGDSSSYDVTVVGPGGTLLLEARVRVPDATALAALEVAAREAGIAIEREEYPGMGTYVRAIGGHRAEGATGWVYLIHREGEWLSGDRSAASYPLQKGDAVRWSWTDG